VQGDARTAITVVIRVTALASWSGCAGRPVLPGQPLAEGGDYAALPWPAPTALTAMIDSDAFPQASALYWT